MSWYRRNADWGTLWRLLPGVLPGLVLGAWFLSVVDDALMRRTIAVILLVMCTVQLWQLLHSTQRSTSVPDSQPHRLTTVGAGTAAGFATMTANAAGPITTVYLIQAGLPMLRMIGTGAWFFLAVNVAKVPFSAGLGLITPTSLVRDALLVPALLVGAGLGILLVGRLGSASSRWQRWASRRPLRCCSSSEEGFVQRTGRQLPFCHFDS